MAAHQSGQGQVLGGASSFNFIKLPNTPQLSALGGVNISNRSNDVGLAFNNPSLLRTEMNGQLQAVFNSMLGGIKNYTLVGGYTVKKINTNVGLGINYLDYGTLELTDPSGNNLGNFHPKDYMLQLMVSRSYESRWQYGMTFKYIQSLYGQYRSSAIALDAAGSYYDSSNLFQASLLLKNMGAQLQPFVPGVHEQLPFDIQLGISKRLLKAPFQFSFTAHHLHQFDLLYNDTSSTLTGGQQINSSGINKLFQHFVFSVQCYIDEKIELTAGYNHLRRTELQIDNSSNGLTGFSIGLGYTGRKLQLRYARSWYESHIAYNQFGLNILLF